MSLKTICTEKYDTLNAMAEDHAAALELRSRAQKLQQKFAYLKDKSPDLDVCTDLLSALHEFQRISFFYHAGSTPDVIREVEDKIGKEQPIWKDIPVLDVDKSLRRQLAGRMIHSVLQHREGDLFPNSVGEEAPPEKPKTLLQLAPPARGTAEYVAEYLLKYDVPWDVKFTDDLFIKALIDASSPEVVVAFSSHVARQQYEGVKKVISLIARPPLKASDETAGDPEGLKKDLYEKSYDQVHKDAMTGDLFYTQTRIPTREDAAIDKIPYKKYLKFFFELCDQPWEFIQRAHETLKARLEGAKTLHIIDEDTGTNLSMEIDGKRWVSSTLLKNVPGSEVFASPGKDTVEGTLVAPGRFQFRDFPIVENIRLEFRKGRIWKFDADKGRDTLAKVIEADDGKGEGTRFIGEIGIGTNPWLKKHLINSLLVEKISGSVHLALGGAYEFKRYDGQDVAVDNGNRSDSHYHWDITTMLKGPRAKIVLDKGTDQEYTLMQKGRFQDEALQVLNDGWAAPDVRDHMPEYWKERVKKPPLELRGRPAGGTKGSISL